MTIRMSSTALAAFLAIAASQSLSAQRAAQGPNFHKNSVKFSDVGAKPVTGRSGSASLQARALLAADGSVQVDASTGDLDAGSAPGQIRKMQMKVLSPTHKPTSTLNFDGNSTGHWTTTLAKVGAGSSIQLQANIGGIDGNRTDVVTVTVPVKRRPDLAVDALSAPGRAIAGAPMNIVATVSERNGDVGARASCMLSIDGQLSDQARDIWVDAGKTVSCAFQTSIATVGSHTVMVYVTGVTPTDWNPNNNSASTTVQVLSPEVALGYSATFTATDASSYFHQKNSTADGSYLDEQTSQTTRLERTLSMTSSTSANSFTFPVSVRSALMADGASVFDYTNSVAIQTSDATSDCGEVINGRFYLQVCNLHSGTPTSQVIMSSFDGRVTYFGSRFYQVDGSDAYVTNDTTDTPMGAGGYAVTTSVQPVLELHDARGILFSARPMMSLQSTPINDVYSGCYFSPYNQVNYCTDAKTTGTTRTGSANGSVQ